jgi:hypothetical protein
MAHPRTTLPPHPTSGCLKGEGKTLPPHPTSGCLKGEGIQIFAKKSIIMNYYKITKLEESLSLFRNQQRFETTSHTLSSVKCTNLKNSLTNTKLQDQTF